MKNIMYSGKSEILKTRRLIDRYDYISVYDCRHAFLCGRKAHNQDIIRR